MLSGAPNASCDEKPFKQTPACVPSAIELSMPSSAARRQHYLQPSFALHYFPGTVRASYQPVRCRHLSAIANCPRGEYSSTARKPSTVLASQVNHLPTIQKLSRVAAQCRVQKMAREWLASCQEVYLGSSRLQSPTNRKNTPQKNSRSYTSMH